MATNWPNHNDSCSDDANITSGVQLGACNLYQHGIAPAGCFQRSIRNGRAKSTSNALKHRRRPWTKLYDGQQSKSLLYWFGNCRRVCRRGSDVCEAISVLASRNVCICYLLWWYIVSKLRLDESGGACTRGKMVVLKSSLTWRRR
jgi:hypothetical protein